MATRAGLQWAPLLTTLPSSLLNRVPACQSCHIVSLPQVSPGWGNSSFVRPLCNRGKGDQPWILRVDFPSPGLALGGAISQDAGQSAPSHPFHHRTRHFWRLPFWILSHFPPPSCVCVSMHACTYVSTHPYLAPRVSGMLGQAFHKLYPSYLYTRLTHT